MELNREDLRIYLAALTELAKTNEKKLKELEDKYHQESEESFWLVNLCLKKDRAWIINEVRNATDLNKDAQTNLLRYFEETAPD